MQQVLDKNSKRRMIISTIAMIIVVVVCCVLVQTPLKGKAEAITDADYTILVTKTSNNNKYVLQKMKSDGSTGNFNNTETDNLPVSLDNSGKNIFFNNNEFKTSAKVALLIQTDIEINDTTNINISTTNADGIGLQVDGSLNITGSGDVSVSGGAKGIYTIGTLTINGTGVVNATGTTESGINCGSDITITSGTVNVTGGTQGIVAESNGINISGGKVIVNTIKESDTEDISASLYANTINISGGEIELHIEGLNTKGIYTLGTMSISGDSTNITVEGDVRGTSNSWEYSSIYVGTDMIMDAGSVTVNVTNKTDDTYITGLTTKGCLTVNGGQIDVIVDVGYGESAEIQYGQSDGILVNSNFNLNGDSGYGIYIADELSVINSTVDAKGAISAIYVGNGGSSNIKGKVDASATIDGILVTVDDINTNYSLYKYVHIVPSILSVNITWGDMDYTYTEGTWNTTSHSYNKGSWSNKTTDGDKITVTNNSNVPVLASFAYNQDTKYTDFSGTIMSSRTDGTEFKLAQKVSVSNNLYAYLVMDGRLPSSMIDPSTIGSVTVTISE